MNLRMSTISSTDEIRKPILMFKRILPALKQRKEYTECIDMVVNIIAEHETRLVKHEYEKAIKKWG